MSVKAITMMNNIAPDPTNAGKFIATLVFCGLEPGNLVNTFIYVDNISPAVTAVILEQALKRIVEDELTNNHGYIFGLFDSVRLIGALL